MRVCQPIIVAQRRLCCTTPHQIIRLYTTVMAAMVLISFAAACQRPVAPEPDALRDRPLADEPRRDTHRASEFNATAAMLIEQGRFEQARDALEKALEADVMFGPAHNNLGKVYYHQGRLYHAAWAFEYAMHLMPDRPEPRGNLGLVFEAAGKLDKARAQYADARELAPDNPEYIGNLARTRLRQGERSNELRDLLAELIMKDHRPEWIEWARKHRALLNPRDDHVDTLEP